MTFSEAAKNLAVVLRAENDALAAGDYAVATGLLSRKESAAAELRRAATGTDPDAGLTTTLRDLVQENGERLAMALRVQERIIEMIAQAARQAAPQPVRYHAPGRPRSPIGALALTLRA